MIIKHRKYSGKYSLTELNVKYIAVYNNKRKAGYYFQTYHENQIPLIPGLFKYFSFVNQYKISKLFSPKVIIVLFCLMKKLM